MIIYFYVINLNENSKNCGIFTKIRVKIVQSNSRLSIMKSIVLNLLKFKRSVNSDNQFD